MLMDRICTVVRHAWSRSKTSQGVVPNGPIYTALFIANTVTCSQSSHNEVIAYKWPSSSVRPTQRNRGGMKFLSFIQLCPFQNSYGVTLSLTPTCKLQQFARITWSVLTTLPRLDMRTPSPMHFPRAGRALDGRATDAWWMNPGVLSHYGTASADRCDVISRHVTRPTNSIHASLPLTIT